MHIYYQFKNKNQFTKYVFLSLLYTTAFAIVDIKAEPLNHQLSPWYMQTRDRDVTLIGSSSIQQPRNQIDAQLEKNCIEPNSDIYGQFISVHNRSFTDNYDKSQRWKLFEDTFKRAIVFNEILDGAFNREPTSEIYFYTYIKSDDLWYSDINDCELAHIKYTITSIFDLIDKNEYALALNHLKQANVDFPLLNGESMKQACHILLVRLHDRALDQWIDKWFQWQTYFRKLAAYSFNQRQLQELAHLGLASQLELYSFVHPKFYKDIRFNDASLNKVAENKKILKDFNTINVGKNLQVSAQEKNERIELFRRRWTMARLINDKLTNSNQFSLNFNQTANNYQDNYGRSYRASSEFDDSKSAASLLFLGRLSDLSDEELVAYINDDPSYVKKNLTSVSYYKQIPIVVLNNDTKKELVNEILLRRKPNNNWSDEDKINFADQLISDLGLPVGSKVYFDDNDNVAASAAFSEVGRKFKKNYMTNNDPYRLRHASEEETQKRKSIFFENYPKIRAWQLKEDWRLSNEQSVQMLRLADMSWDEIKFTLLKLCCLTNNQKQILENNNSTIRYLLSNQICQKEVETREEQNQQFLKALELFYYYLVYNNKHHQNHHVYADRFAKFSKNLADMTKYSCDRNFALFHLLESNKFYMSMVDDKVLDDINLDRFFYYEIESDKNSRDGDDNMQSLSKNNEDASWFRSFFGNRNENRDPPYGGREGTIHIYSQEFFNPLQDERLYNQSQYKSVNEKLIDDRYGVIKNSMRDRDSRNTKINFGNIYNFVKNRYKLCLDMRIIEDSSTPQCRPYTSSDELERQVDSQSYNNQRTDKCSQYKNGLDLYPNGLHSIKVPRESASHITHASCRKRGLITGDWNNNQYSATRHNQ